MADLVEDLLRSNGPSLSTDLAAQLRKRSGLSPVAARKRISRPSANVKRLAYLPFPRNARFLYLKSDFGSPRYWGNLIQALLANNSAYGLALSALQQRGGIIPAKHFPIACGAPRRQKKHLSSDTVLERLKKAQLIDEYDMPGVGPCVALLEGPGRYDNTNTEIRARLLVEDILLKALSTWLQRLGFVSYNKIAVRDMGASQPMVGTFAWDLSAPCYLAPFIELTPHGIKQGFIACDVLSGIEVTKTGLRPFIHKCVTLRQFKRIGRCLQIFVADHFLPDAFELAKENRIIPATPANLFGDEIGAGLIQLFEILRNVASVSIDPEMFNEVFKRLGSIGGAAANLRGALFEYLVADINRNSDTTYVDTNRICRLQDGSRVESDVVAVRTNRSVTFIECKGYQPAGTLPDELLKKWRTRTAPRLYEYARTHPEWRNLEIHFEFWTTGKLSDVALQSFTTAASEIKPSRYTLEILDSTAIRDRAKALKNPSLLKVLDAHFFEHPLATAERAVERMRIRRPYPLAQKEATEEILQEASPTDEFTPRNDNDIPF